MTYPQKKPANDNRTGALHAIIDVIAYQAAFEETQRRVAANDDQPRQAAQQ